MRGDFKDEARRFEDIDRAAVNALDPLQSVAAQERAMLLEPVLRCAFCGCPTKVLVGCRLCLACDALLHEEVGQ